MALLQLLRDIRNPPADSLVGMMPSGKGFALRWIPFVMLIHLIWMYIWPILAHASFSKVIVPSLLSVPVFLYFYLQCYYGPLRRLFVHGCALIVLGFAVAPFNYSSGVYLIFAFFAMAYGIPVRKAWMVVAVSTVIYGAELVLVTNNYAATLSGVVPVAVLGIVAIYMAYSTRQMATLRRSNEEIMRLATIAERERIGRDLHDLLGHTLSVVALKSELARKLIDRDLDAARAEIGEVERVARDALAQVRNAVSGIRSTALAAEIVAARALLEAQGLKVQCETESVKLPHDHETALALSLREATTNIRRHAGARGVTIRVRQEPEHVVMEVADDGRGGRIVPGNGLNGMRERLDTVGGTLRLEANQQGGTRLWVSIPVGA